MSATLPYRETDAQKLTFEILEDSEDLFEGIDTEDWDAVKERLQSIEELNLSGYNKISDLSIVGEMTSLKRLDFSRTAVADISWAKSLKNLEIIRFNTTPVSGLGALAELENLKEIRANHCIEITSADIEAICPLFKEALEELYLRRTSKALDAIIRRKKNKYPRVHIRHTW